MRRRISLDELPRHHAIARQLLQGEALPQRTKNSQEVTREFDVEKWGALLGAVEKSGKGFRFAHVDDIHSAAYGDCVSVRGDALYADTLAAATARFRRMVARELQSHLPASAIVEFGAGYGGMFFPVAAAMRGKGLPLVALEYARSGRELIGRVAEAEGLPVTVGGCDLGATEITATAIPAGSILFTSYAAHYVPTLTQDFVSALSALEPKVVVHFEPVLHPELQDTTLGILRRRYLEASDYNRNLLEVLTSAERDGRIRIHAVDPNWFGVNPLLPASRIVWSPA